MEHVVLGAFAFTLVCAGVLALIAARDLYRDK